MGLCMHAYVKFILIGYKFEALFTKFITHCSIRNPIDVLNTFYSLTRRVATDNSQILGCY
jgi:hypothetical protein